MFGLERGLLATLRDLILRPGLVVRAFLGGDDRRYLGPGKLFLLVTALTLLMQPAAISFDALIVRMLGDGQVFAQRSEAADWIRDWNALVYAPLMLLFAASTRFFFRARGLNYAEHLVVAAYGWSGMLLLANATWLPIWAAQSAFGRAGWLALLVLLPPIYWLWFCRDVFRLRGAGDGVRALATLPFAYLMFGTLLALATGLWRLAK